VQALRTIASRSRAAVGKRIADDQRSRPRKSLTLRVSDAAAGAALLTHPLEPEGV